MRNNIGCRFTIKEKDEFRLAAEKTPLGGNGFLKAANSAEVPEGSVSERLILGREILLCRRNGIVYALSNTCPHVGGPLSQGNFDDHIIVCPWHAWEFDCRTGQCLMGGNTSIETFAVRESGGEVFIAFGEETVA
jgi:nitrite reductase/ring-hydroxylating ferredoxin subunit